MLSLIILLFSLSPFLQNASDSTTVKSSIENVTVFRSQAQIERTATVALKAGKNLVVFTDLSEAMITNSVQLKGKGTFTLISITNRNNFIEGKSNSALVNQLTTQRDSLQNVINTKRALINVINSNISLLSSSNNIANNHKLTAAELNALLDLNSKRLYEFEEKKLALNSDIVELNKKIQLLTNKIRESGATTRNRFKEVLAEIEVESAQKMVFSLQYLVYTAGWNPVYDIRSESVDKPLNIDFKAKVFQNTGYDWTDVNFTINSGDPSQSIQKPELFPNYVGFFNSRKASSSESGSKSVANIIRTQNQGVVEGIILDSQTGEVLTGAVVAFPELRLGGTVDSDGKFSINNVPNGNHLINIAFIGYKNYSSRITINNSGLMINGLLSADVLALDEVVVTGYESNKLQGRLAGISIVPEFSEPVSLVNQEISNQTSFSYKIDRPYSVPSDGKEYSLSIKSEKPATEYMYSTVPKISQNAFLIGKLTNWDELNLIEGDANIYFENGFVGATYLDPESLLDSLEISLGKDERIVVDRRKLKDFEERRFFGSKTRESLSYEISIRNTKSETIQIVVQDQIPISTDESIKVSEKELSGGKLDKQTGIVTWRLTLSPNETKKLKMNFQVEYPKGKRIRY